VRLIAYSGSRLTTASGERSGMLITTTSTLQDREVRDYLGLVSGEAILGANVFRDFFANIRDIVGGRSAAYEKELRRAKAVAIEEMSAQAKDLGANAVIGVDLDYETIGQSMLMVVASGTAVVSG
jgi:uncharacterized protein YbjQ (UPF0145 family)